MQRIKLLKSSLHLNMFLSPTLHPNPQRARRLWEKARRSRVSQQEGSRQKKTLRVHHGASPFGVGKYELVSPTLTNRSSRRHPGHCLRLNPGTRHSVSGSCSLLSLSPCFSHPPQVLQSNILPHAAAARAHGHQRQRLRHVHIPLTHYFIAP